MLFFAIEFVFLFNKANECQKKKKREPTDPKIIRQRQVLFGGGLFLLAFLLALAFTSYLLHWKADYSTLDAFFDKTVAAKNILNKIGAVVSHFFIYQGVGLAAVFFPYLIGLTGVKLFFDQKTNTLLSNWGWGIAHLLWFSLALGYFFPSEPLYSGIVGYEINLFFSAYIGRIGILAVDQTIKADLNPERTGNLGAPRLDLEDIKC